MARTGADLVVECLAAEGIELVAGVPGTTIMDLIDSLARQDAVRYVSTRHEQVAGFLADGYSRSGRGLGVCLASRGPGAANLAIAVHNAYDESVPLLALIGQVPADVVDRRAFEEMDVLATFRPMAKWVVEVHQPDRIPELLQRAVRLARSGRPGPVVVSLPLNVLKGTADAVPAPRRLPYPPAPAPEAVGAAWSLLEGAERPAILLGGGAVGDHREYTALAEAVAAPLLTTWLRQGLVPHSHPAYLGALGYGAHEVSERAVAEADVLLAIGCRFSEFTTNRWTLIAPETRLVHVDIDPSELGRVYLPDVGIVADAQQAVRALLSAAPDQDRTARQARPGELRSARDARLGKLRASYVAAVRDVPEERQAGGVSGAAACRALGELADREEILLVQDAPSFGPWTMRHLPLPRPGMFFGSAGGAMAWGLPAGMGIALARPDRRVVTVSGDGSFWMVAQDFETCVREAIPLVNVVMNNFSYGNTRDRQRMAHEGRYHGVFYGNPDFAAFARDLGGFGRRVEKDEDLAPALEEALAQPLPAIIDVVQDRMAGLPPGLAPPAAR